MVSIASSIIAMRYTTDLHDPFPPFSAGEPGGRRPLFRLPACPYTWPQVARSAWSSGMRSSFPAIRDCFRKHPLLRVVQPQLPVCPCELRFQFENPPCLRNRLVMSPGPVEVPSKNEIRERRSWIEPHHLAAFSRASSSRPIAIKNWLYHWCTSALLGLSRTTRLCSCSAPAQSQS